MEFIWDPVASLNLIFCVVIVVLGYLGYRKKRNPLPILVGVAFGLFGVSHLLTILSLNEVTVLLVIRGLGYLIVMFALYKFLKNQAKPK
jgi:hypothetical protein